MNRVSDIIDRLGGNASVSREIGVKPSAVSEMKRRNSIPPRYWSDLIAMAKERGAGEITADMLVAIHTAPSGDEAQAGAAA